VTRRRLMTGASRNHHDATSTRNGAAVVDRSIHAPRRYRLSPDEVTSFRSVKSWSAKEGSSSPRASAMTLCTAS